MKAVRVHAFGGPEKLSYDEVPRPEPGPGDVLIRVHAAGMNPPDWYARSGFRNIPKELRPTLDLPFTPGTDVSGVVVAVGSDVDRWRPGDAVFGLVRFPPLSGKGYAEYTTAPAGQLAAKPAGLDHVHAAGVPMAGLTAYQFLVDHVRLDKARTVLVNGAAGGVGHFLVQLAKTRDAHVIAVASGRHTEFLKDLGADQVIDYTATDVADLARDVDHVFDAVGGPDGHRFLTTVKRGGTISPIFPGSTTGSARPSWASRSYPARCTPMGRSWRSWRDSSTPARCVSASTASSRSPRRRRPTSGPSAGTFRGRSSCEQPSRVPR